LSASGGRGAALNLVANVAGHGTSMLAGLFFTSYLVRTLGIDGYALVPLATAMSAFMAPLTAALNAAAARDLTMALANDDAEGASVAFNSAMAGTLLLTLGMAACALPVALFPEWFFRIPAGLEGSARGLLTMSVAGYLLTTAASPFEMATYARNRFDLRSGIAVGGTLFRIGTTFAAIELLGADPRHVGLGMFASSAFAAAMSWVASRRLLPTARLRLGDVSAGALRRFLRTGGWTLVLQIGTVLFLSVDVVLVNRVIGPREAGYYALAITWTNVLFTLATIMGGVFGPEVLAAWARRDLDAFVERSRRAVRVVALLIPLPIALVAGFSASLLRVWQGPDFEHLAPLLAGLTLPLLLALPYNPLNAVFMATDSMRLPATTQLGAGVVKLALAYVLMAWTGLGVYGMALAGMLLMVARGTLFTAGYAARLCERPTWAFLGEAVRGCVLGALVTALAWVVSERVAPVTWAGLAAAGAGVAAVYAGLAWVAFLGADERAFVRGRVTGLIARGRA
jgi:membrane protein EpsK